MKADGKIGGKNRESYYTGKYVDSDMRIFRIFDPTLSKWLPSTYLTTLVVQREMRGG